MSLDPKDCIHAIGIIPRGGFSSGYTILDRDDTDLLEESGAVPFNFCPWCGSNLKGEEFADGLPESPE